MTSFSVHVRFAAAMLYYNVQYSMNALSPSLWSNAGSYLSIVSISWTGSYLYYNMQAMDGYLPVFLRSDGESAFRLFSTVHYSTPTWPL